LLGHGQAHQPWVGVWVVATLTAHSPYSYQSDMHVVCFWQSKRPNQAIPLDPRRRTHFRKSSNSPLLVSIVLIIILRLLAVLQQQYRPVRKSSYSWTQSAERVRRVLFPLVTWSMTDPAAIMAWPGQSNGRVAKCGCSLSDAVSVPCPSDDDSIASQ
jgi:hypothetical protein